MKYPIDLGKKMGGMEPISSPSKEIYYPTLHLEWGKPYDFPEEGTMVVKFKKGSETTSRHGGKVTQSLSMDILEIVSVTGETPTKSENPGDRLDTLRKEVEALEGGY